MPEIRAYVPGVYARSERGDEDPRAFLEAQREAGLDYLSDGLLNWGDIFRPFAAAVERLSERFEPLGEPFFRVGELPRGGWVATLPSPHSLAGLAPEDVEPLVVAERVIGPQIRWLAENGCAYVVLQETALFGGRIDMYPLSESLDALASPLPLALQLPFGDAGNVLGELMEIAVDAIGVDLHATDAASLPRPFPKTLLAGVVNARDSRLEQPEELAEIGQSLLEDMDEGTELHLVPNGDLLFVPETVAREKVLALGAAARTLKDQELEEGAVT